ncbi:hypothetical protein PAXINDRAFT_13243 [Paxillus involutus ATCC 200175]|uniref:Uncharacterized protein n=1 Tax=Paxillus involutus ATCC 200175 TaxID=664439 RepID=A0A0C9U2Y3_PAXIN|nr:hypothetical protein PAXINDRAFT_13243 [Paxillus involutus ATCC 200175]
MDLGGDDDLEIQDYEMHPPTLTKPLLEPLSRPLGQKSATSTTGKKPTTPKPKPPSWDSGRTTAFTRHTPYPPPSSICSSNSLPSMVSIGKAPSTSTTRRGASSSGTDFKHRFDELEGEGSLQYNFAVRDKELSMQHEEHAAKLANTDAEHRRQVDLKKLDIELKQVEENAVSKRVQLLQLQIELARMQTTGARPYEDMDLDVGSHQG